MSALTATIEPRDDPPGETAVVLRIANTSAEPVEVVDPDLGRPSDNSGWPHSVEAYRACQLMSFGFLTVAVLDEDGEAVEKMPVSTWSTPIRRPDLVLSPGETLDVVIPLGPFYELVSGRTYRVSAEYGHARGEGVVEAG